MNRRRIMSSFALLLMVGLAACRRAQPTAAPKQHSGLGDDWLSMTTSEKTIFVEGFIEGRYVGADDICNTGLVILPKKHRPGDENLSEYERCGAMSGRYSHQDPKTGEDAYIRVIDTFYSHPECRPMPYFTLLEHLDDAEYKSGEELYQFVRSGPGWGQFTIDGIDKCLWRWPVLIK
jgi:hypothetical protein